MDQEWRLWLFQTCTQWGYFLVCLRRPINLGNAAHIMQTSPPDQKLPRIVSRLHTLENESKICRQAFPPGEHFTIPPLPNVTVVNALGDFSITRDRLAIIDGEGAVCMPSLQNFTFYIDPTPHFCTCLRTRYAASPPRHPLFRTLMPLYFSQLDRQGYCSTSPRLYSGSY